MTTDVKRDGAFPYYGWSTSTPWIDGAMPMGEGLAVPRMTAAQAASSTSVRIDYDSEMKHSNPADSADSLNPANYVFDVSGGVARTAQSVSLFQANPTIVIVSLDGEMTDGADYSVTVSNVTAMGGTILDPLYSHLHFAGIGIAPQVSSASANIKHVTIVFDEPMDNNAALTTNSNYTFTGPTSLTTKSVTRVNSTEVDVETNEDMQEDGAYTAHVATGTGICDLAWNGLGPVHTAEFVGAGLPQVTAAIVLAYNCVRVTFSEEMLHVDPYDSDDSLCPTNYIFSAIDGVPIYPSSIALHQASPTIVDITLTGEMTNGANYSVLVWNVQDLEGHTVSEDHDTQDFIGLGIAPRVLTAKALTPETIKASVDEPMLYTPAIVDLASYHLSGPTTLTPSSITPLSTTEVLIGITGEMRTGGSYTFSLGFPPTTGIQDEAWNNLDPDHHTADFTGLGAAPEVSPDALPQNNQQVWVVFNEEVETVTAEDESNYEIIGGSPPASLVVTSAVKLNATTVLLNTASQASAVLYTITVSGVTDLAGNPVEAPANVATFYGLGFSPPDIDFAPVDGTKKVGLRTKLRVHIADTSHEFTGVKRSSIWVQIRYTQGGGTYTRFAVHAGNIMPGFSGEVTGDPLTAAGISFYVCPSERWPIYKDITVLAYAEDLESSHKNAQESHFTTAQSPCFEDNLPTVLDIETKLLSSLSPYGNAEKLRRLLLECCTQSSVPQVRARTVMYLAAMTDMKTFLAGSFDFSKVDDILLCERQSTMFIYNSLRPYMKFAKLAIEELPGFSKEGKDLLQRYLSSNSPVYVVNAIALAVVLTAIQRV